MANTGAVRLGEDVSAARAEPAPPQLQDTSTVMNKSSGQFRSTGIQINLPETLPAAMEKPNQQHVIDEEAILQLMKNCPVCKRKCRCSKHSRGPYLIVYQGCYFCNYQRKWGSQPEATNINIYKPYTQHKKKSQTKDKASVNAKAQLSQLNKGRVLNPQSKSPTTK